MTLFKKAIGGNEEILSQNLDVESGLWAALQARRILNDQQLEICKTVVS